MRVTWKALAVIELGTYPTHAAPAVRVEQPADELAQMLLDDGKLPRHKLDLPFVFLQLAGAPCLPLIESAWEHLPRTTDIFGGSR
jgi:hypothetical protein